MTNQTVTIDDMPMRRFHYKVITFTAGGYFLDGYVLGIVGVALAVWAPQAGFGNWWTGAIGAATLVGIFIGALGFGRLTDRVGRQPMFIADLVAFILLSILQFWVSEPSHLLIVRLLMGIAIGVDYTLASPLLSEFIPRKYRGRALAVPQAAAVTGIGVAFVAGFAMTGLGADSWRWMLMSTIVPALIVLLLRLGAPESPRWLASKGRIEEAQAIIRTHLGDGVVLGDEPEEPRQGRFRDLFQNGMWRRTLFAGGFWACQVMPFFALTTFAEQVGSQLGMRSSYTAGLALNAFQIIGVIVGVFILDKFTRRGFTVGTFLIAGVALALFGLLADGSPLLAVACFAIYGLVLSAGTTLEGVFPAEAFPTEVRATGYGVATAISRLGAVVSTLLFPSLMGSFGTQAVVLCLAGILFVGMFISILWAPETRGLTLAEAGRVQGGPRRRRESSSLCPDAVRVDVVEEQPID